MAAWLCLLSPPHPMTLLKPFKKTDKRRSLLAGALKLHPSVALPHFFGSGHLLSLVISPLGMLSLSDHAFLTRGTNSSPHSRFGGGMTTQRKGLHDDLRTTHTREQPAADKYTASRFQ